MNKSVILLMVIAIFTKIFGFARDITLSYFYGASNVSDAYLLSLTIPLLIFGYIGAGISTGYIPMYGMVIKELGERAANRYTNNLINILMVVCTCFIICGLLFTDYFVKAFALGFEGDTLELAVNLTRISLLGIYFTGLVCVFNGLFQLKGNFILPALVGLPLNFIIMISIWLSTRTNIMVLAEGSVIAIASQVLLLIPFLYQTGYRYKLVLDLKDKYIITMVKKAIPVIFGVSVNQINVLVDRTIASLIATGGISALSYAGNLNLFIQGLFVLPFVTVMYPSISRMASEDNIAGLKKKISEVIGYITLFVMPATVGAMIFAEPIIKLFYGRGAFDSQAISMSADALFFSAIGMLGIGIRDVLSRTFYSMHNTKTPMVNAAIALLMNISLNIVLSKYLGLGGLALATSISAIFCSVLLGISLRKKIGCFGIKNLILTFIKILCASVTMGILAKCIYKTLLNNISSNTALFVAIGTGAAVYFVIILFMRIEEVDVMKKRLIGRLL